MKRPSLFLVLVSSLFLLVATQCDDDDGITCDERAQSLTELATEIETLINTSECGEDFECRFIAFGSKACGGPQSYLAYSTSIDTLELQNLVSMYNSDENAYNIACDIVSTCDFIGPPSGVECINGVCTLID